MFIPNANEVAPLQVDVTTFMLDTIGLTKGTTDSIIAYGLMELDAPSTWEGDTGTLGADEDPPGKFYPEITVTNGIGTVTYEWTYVKSIREDTGADYYENVAYDIDDDTSATPVWDYSRDGTAAP